MLGSISGFPASRNLINTTLKVSTKRIPFYVGFTKKGNRTILTEDGWYSALFLLIQQNLGFQYDLEVEKSSGFRLKNGTWTGNTGSLASNRSDVAFPLTINWQRFSAVEFCFPVVNERVVFFLRAPRELSRTLAMIRPFSLEVWIAIGVSLLLGMAALYAMFRLDARIDYVKPIRLKDVFWALFSTLTAQGNNLFLLPVNTIKIFMACWILCIYILVYGYAGSLISFITFPGMESTVTTFEKLARVIRDDGFTGSTIRHSTIETYIQNLATGTFSSLKQSMERNKIEAVNVSSNPFTRVLEGNHAYITYDVFGKIVATGIGSEKFYMSEDVLYSSFSSFATRKNFIYTKQFSRLIRRCVETGLVSKMIQNEMDKVGRKNEYSYDDKHHSGFSLRIEDLQGIFLILIIGYITAAVSLIGELIIKRAETLQLKAERDQNRNFLTRGVIGTEIHHNLKSCSLVNVE